MSKTNITPKDIFEKRNTSDVFNRLVIMGMLRILNKKLIYEQVWSKDEVQSVTVPFFFNFGMSSNSSERFIQDNYTFFSSDECTEIGLKKIDGNFDFYPQGRIQLNSVGIQSGNISNRFSMAQFTRIIDGKPQAFTSYLYSIPLEFSFQLEIRAENMITAFKIDQAVREFFYKNHTFHFNYKGTIVPARAGFPENGISVPNTQYNMGQAQTDQYIKLTYSISVETYQPVFDRFNEMPADRYAGIPGLNIYANNKEDGSKGTREKKIEWATSFNGLTLVSGQEVMIKWNWFYRDNDLLKVDLLYQIEGDKEREIVMAEDNHDFYYWQIDEHFTNNPKIDIVYEDTERCSASQTPKIFVWPDPQTRVVDSENVYVASQGFFITSNPDGVSGATLMYEDKNGRIIQKLAQVNLHNFMVDRESVPMEFECFVYEGEFNPKKVRLIVRDHNDRNIKAESEWFYIV